MKTKTRERAIRTIISSFLQSDLTSTEINEISKAFIYDDIFVQDLGKVLDQVSEVIYHKSKKQPDSTNVFETDLIDKALKIIKRRRLSKKKIISIIQNINPSISNKLETKINSLTVAKLLSQFYKHTEINEFSEFINLIDGESGSTDKYLNGIIDR